MWKWNVRPLQAGRRDRISNIEELCVFGHFHLYFDRQTWTSTHKTQPHTNCGKHLTHSTLFLKGAPHTHTHTSRHMQKCGHTSYKHAICTEWHVCVQNYTRGETVQWEATWKMEKAQIFMQWRKRTASVPEQPSTGEVKRERDPVLKWQAKTGRERENQYLYLTRREQRKEVQSCSRQELEERGRRAMGLWQGGGSAGQAGGWRDARRGRGGQEWVGMEGERSKGEGEKKHVL